jgi:2'-5' RNA ligase
MPAHITLLYPFIPPHRIDEATEYELGKLAEGHPSFGFELVRAGRFPGVLYLDPEPQEPFIELTQAVVEHWPDYPPYGGEFDHVVPHLTIAQAAEPTAIADDLAGHLPITAEARELHLMTQGRDGRWSVRARFTLGSAR